MTGARKDDGKEETQVNDVGEKGDWKKSSDRFWQLKTIATVCLPKPDMLQEEYKQRFIGAYLILWHQSQQQFQTICDVLRICRSTPLKQGYFRKGKLSGLNPFISQDRHSPPSSALKYFFDKKLVR